MKRQSRLKMARILCILLKCVKFFLQKVSEIPSTLKLAEGIYITIMDSTLAIVGVLMVAALFGSVFIKSYLDKKNIESARELVELQDALRRMQTAQQIIPELYIDIPTKIFMAKRTMQLAYKMQELSGDDAAITMLIDNMQEKLNKAQGTKDNRAVRLSKWSDINNPDTAHEVKHMVKFLHGEMVASVKSGIIPKALGTRVTANLRIMAPRIAMDLNYNLARAAIKSNKLRPALGKLRITKALLLKSTIKQHMKTQIETVEKLITETEKKMNAKRKKVQAQSANKLASGLNDLEEKEQWDQKKNLYE